MNALYRDAILKASDVRRQLKLNMFQPMNIFDACITLGIDVKFININMEGLYIQGRTESTILISNQRPMPRRCFTAAHELGHHVFKHGLKVDVLTDDINESLYKDKDEILVDAFAAALLMPIGGIQAEFSKRGWSFEKATPPEYYIISSVFNVGYHTIINHCQVNRLISDTKASSLKKYTPAQILAKQFGKSIKGSHFKIIDRYCETTSIDLEVSNYIVLPDNLQVDEQFLEKVIENEMGNVYLAIKSGITSTNSIDDSSNHFIRIQRENYIGLAEYRHLED